MIALLVESRSIRQRKYAGHRLAKFQANNLRNSDRQARAEMAVRPEAVRAAIVLERRQEATMVKRERFVTHVTCPLQRGKKMKVEIQKRQSKAYRMVSRSVRG